MRLIDTEELYEILCHDENHGLRVSHMDGYKDSVYLDGCGNDFLSIINKATIVDAVEVVHAQWVNPYINRYGHPCHCCSVCGFKASYQDKNYCPNCGAKMEELK